MRALSLRQAARCETAKNKACSCRCGGVLHGAAREQMSVYTGREFYEALPADDPHRLPTKEEQKQKRKDRARVKKAGKQGLLWAIFEEENA